MKDRSRTGTWSEGAAIIGYQGLGAWSEGTILHGNHREPKKDKSRENEKNANGLSMPM